MKVTLLRSCGLTEELLLRCEVVGLFYPLIDVSLY